MAFSFGFLLLIGFFKTRSGGLWWPLLIKHSEEDGLYAANTGIKHTEEYDLYSESGYVNKQRSKHSLCFNKENMIDIYYYK